MKGITILYGILVIPVVVLATDYCSSNICKKGVKHIACHHDGKFANTCPPNAKMVNINEPLKQVLLNAHNTKRNFIAGGGDKRFKRACRMATMQWDNELAHLAAFNVKQCKMAHDACRNTDAFRSSGQNLGWESYVGRLDLASILTGIVERWYSERNVTKQAYIDNYPRNYIGPQIGHFTVMMVDRNVRVGCAAATYTPKNQRQSVCLLACNYASTNMINRPIYTHCKGTACGSGRNPRYKNLCSVNEKYDVNKRGKVNNAT